MEKCPICQSLAEPFYLTQKRNFYQCSFCKTIYCPSRYFPDFDAEGARYRTHNNDVNDPAYQTFVKPVVEVVKTYFSPEHVGLDYGAGPGPVISKLLHDQGYQLSLYDPFFHPDKEQLKKKYDFIVACEVIEHFHYPTVDFQLLFDMLNPGGKLICMTSIYNESIDFKNWYYKNDPTHVIFYHEKSLEFIKSHFGFSQLDIQGNVIVFSK
ncbi:MAG: class I SAM-dependent methyltransferase [Bacteroidota bacterium]|nr:class I SAM-dependent methyltransferase [Bacteroidota bacterium]